MEVGDYVIARIFTQEKSRGEYFFDATDLKWTIITAKWNNESNICKSNSITAYNFFDFLIKFETNHSKAYPRFHCFICWGIVVVYDKSGRAKGFNTWGRCEDVRFIYNQSRTFALIGLVPDTN